MQSLEVSNEAAAPRAGGPNDISFADACKRLKFLLAALVALPVVLLVVILIRPNNGDSPTSSGAANDIAAAANKWVYDDAVATQELARLGSQYDAYHSLLGEPAWWESGLDDQPYSSIANSDVPGGNISNHKGPNVYKYEDYRKASDPLPDVLPYTDIADNTESIAAFEDIFYLIPQNAFLLDIGGGRYDSNTRWVQNRSSNVTMMVADPFNRMMAHNVIVQAEVAKRCGADIVTSMSVLNVIPDVKSQTWHVWLVHHLLKPGNLAIFKFWAGLWPVRGTRNQTVAAPMIDPTAANTQSQNNAFAEAYEPLIAKVFGAGNVFADSNQNLIVARKSSSSRPPCGSAEGSAQQSLRNVLV